MSSVGLFFGSFNPIHIGHMAIANYLVEYGPIDELWFVVTPHNPIKKKRGLLDNYQRLEMVNRAIGDDLRFRASAIEFNLPQPNYTINTLTYLSEKYPSRKFYLIIGSDNYVTLKKWKNWETLIALYHFLVYPRPGFDQASVDFKGHFQLLDAPLIEISSTFIRKAIKEGKNIRHFMPPAVFKYIDEMSFYR